MSAIIKYRYKAKTARLAKLERRTLKYINRLQKVADEYIKMAPNELQGVPCDEAIVISSMLSRKLDEIKSNLLVIPTCEGYNIVNKKCVEPIIDIHHFEPIIENWIDELDAPYVELEYDLASVDTSISTIDAFTLNDNDLNVQTEI